MISALKNSNLSFRASARDLYNNLLSDNKKIAQAQEKIAQTTPSSNMQIPMSGAQQGQNLDVVA